MHSPKVRVAECMIDSGYMRHARVSNTLPSDVGYCSFHSQARRVSPCIVALPNDRQCDIHRCLPCQYPSDPIVVTCLLKSSNHGPTRGHCSISTSDSARYRMQSTNKQSGIFAPNFFRHGSFRPRLAGAKDTLRCSKLPYRSYGGRPMYYITVHSQQEG